MLAQGSDKGEIWLWDPATGRKVRTIRVGTEGVSSVAFSSDSQRVISGSGGNSAKVYRVADGHELACLRGHSSRVSSVAFAPRGRLMATGDKSGVVKVWSVETTEQVSSFTAHRAPVVDLAFSPDGTRLVSAGSAEVSHSYNGDNIIMWDPVAGKRLRVWNGINPYTIAFSPDNQCVAVSQSDGRVIVWDEAKEKEAFTFTGHNGGVMGLTFSPDGRQLVSGGSDQTIRFWDLATGRPLFVLHGPRSGVTAVQFSPDGRRLAAREQGRIHIWPAGEPAPASPSGPYRWVRWHREMLTECEDATQWLAAAFHCSRLLETDSEKSALYYQARSWCYFELEDWRHVVADTSAAIDLGPVPPYVWYSRGRAHFALGQWEQANTDFSKHVELAPKAWDGWQWRGETRARLRCWQDAIADYSKAIEFNNKGHQAWLLRGTAWAELERWDQAIADFTVAIEAPGDLPSCADPAWLWHIWRVRDQSGYRKACVSMYERLSDSTDAVDWNDVAWLCSLAANDAAEPARLVRLGERAAAADPNWARINTLGVTLYRAGRFADAIQRLDKAVQMHGKGGSFEDWVFLAMARFRLGNVDQAKGDLAHASAFTTKG